MEDIFGLGRCTKTGKQLLVRYRPVSGGFALASMSLLGERAASNASSLSVQQVKLVEVAEDFSGCKACAGSGCWVCDCGSFNCWDGLSSDVICPACKTNGQLQGGTGGSLNVRGGLG
jgi:hypothetical protein